MPDDYQYIKCGNCDGLGQIIKWGIGPIVSCPVCKGTGNAATKQ